MRAMFMSFLRGLIDNSRGSTQAKEEVMVGGVGGNSSDPHYHPQPLPNVMKTPTRRAKEQLRLIAEKVSGK